MKPIVHLQTLIIRAGSMEALDAERYLVASATPVPAMLYPLFLHNHAIHSS